MHDDPSPCSTTKEAERKWSALPCSKYRLRRPERKAIHRAAQLWLRAWRTARGSAEGAVLRQAHFPSTEVSTQRKKVSADTRNPTTDTAQHPPAGCAVGKVTTRMKYTPTELSPPHTHCSKENTPTAMCAARFLGNRYFLNSCDYVTRKNRRGKEKLVCILFIFLKNVCGFSPLEKLNQKSHF